MIRRLVATMMTLSVAVAACGSRAELDDARHPAVCARFQVVTCGCADGSWGSQSCLPSGVWGPCSCGHANDAGEDVADAPAELPPLPFGLDDPSRCLGGGTILYVFSQSRNRPDWEVKGFDHVGTSFDDDIDLVLNLAAGAPNVSFDTRRLGEPIAAKRYDAVECNIATYKKAATQLWPNYACWPEHVTVVIHEIQWSGTDLQRLTMTWEFEEPYRPGKSIACFHFER